MGNKLENYNSRYLKALDEKSVPLFKKAKILTIVAWVIFLLIGIPSVYFYRVNHGFDTIWALTVIVGIIAIVVIDVFVAKYRRVGNGFKTKSDNIRANIEINHLDSIEISYLDKILEDMDKDICTLSLDDKKITYDNDLLVQNVFTTYYEIVKVSDVVCIYCYVAETNEISFDFDCGEDNFFSFDFDLMKYPDAKKTIMEFLSEYCPDTKIVETTEKEYEDMLEKKREIMEKEMEAKND